MENFNFCRFATFYFPFYFLAAIMISKTCSSNTMLDEKLFDRLASSSDVEHGDIYHGTCILTRQRLSYHST